MCIYFIVNQRCILNSHSQCDCNKNSCNQYTLSSLINNSVNLEHGLKVCNWLVENFNNILIRQNIHSINQQEKDKLLSNIYFYRAKAYQSLAQTEYQKTIDKNPRHYRCHNRMARLYESQHLSQKAQFHHEKAIKYSNKKNPTILYHHARFLKNENNINESIRHFEKAIEIFENEKNQMMNNLEMEQKKRTQAEQKIKKQKSNLNLKMKKIRLEKSNKSYAKTIDKMNKKLNQIENENRNLKMINQRYETLIATKISHNSNQQNTNENNNNNQHCNRPDSQPIIKDNKPKQHREAHCRRGRPRSNQLQIQRLKNENKKLSSRLNRATIVNDALKTIANENIDSLMEYKHNDQYDNNDKIDRRSRKKSVKYFYSLHT